MLSRVRQADRDLRGRIYRYLVKGAVVLVPLVVTIIVFSIVLNFIMQFLSPVTGLIGGVFGSTVPGFLTEATSIAVLIGIMILIGFLSETVPTADEFADVFHAAVEAIPGVGSVYGSFRKMSQSMMQNEGSFRDVKLIEYPDEGSYSIGFVTAGEDTPMTGKDGENLVTLFVPMAPNPFMGGFVIHLPEEKVHDVDLTVQDGIKSTITSGVSLSSRNEEAMQNELKSLEEELGDIFPQRWNRSNKGESP